MAKTIIVSNRLPVNIERKEDGTLAYKPSSGGLATGLGSIYKQGNNLWIGWPGIYLDDENEQLSLETELLKESLSPVFLAPNDFKNYYEGFSNATLWPTFHYFPQYAVYEEKFWEAYQISNQKFCDAILKIVQPEDTIWIHDYHLLLLPQMLRQKFGKISIGFFQHIPFPSYELFRLLPWRRQLLMGMLGADLIGFHTYDDMRHFLSSVNRLAGIGYFQGQVELGNRKIIVDAFPMGIDYDRYEETAKKTDTINREERYRQSLGDQKLMLSIDRLDYSKGIPQRLRAFEQLLEKHPEYRQRVSLFLIVVPSRDTVERYRRLKIEIDELVGRINGQYSRLAWTPIHYFYRSFPIEALCAFYRMAHVALITPLRDGMNLVSKEYVASKLDQKGVLILSEMAGASKELSEAILINPNDIQQITEAMKMAINMPEEEQKKHMTIMQNTLRKYNIHHWVKLFLDRLKESIIQQDALLAKQLEDTIIGVMLRQYHQADTRMIFLDYDGTLVPFANDPMEANPDQELKEILISLSANPQNRVVIISGRGKDVLETWLGDLKVDFISEHGVWLREQGEDWKVNGAVDGEWKKTIHQVLDLYVSRTPNSFVEEKSYSLVWHYRKVETGLGELRTRELSSHLKYLTNNMNLQVLEGDMVVEIKHSNINKGKAAKKWLDKFPTEFVIALGDDKTDEDTFKAMPPQAFTIKIGTDLSAAKYYVQSPQEVRALLKKMCI
jgi:trehalose 6-phosphate synthase/phosphatase